MPRRKQSRLTELRQTQKQLVNVTIHMAEKAKRRKTLGRGGRSSSRRLPQYTPQPVPPSRLQSVIHLPPEFVKPSTPFRPPIETHPQYTVTTEHLRREHELRIKEMTAGISQLRNMMKEKQVKAEDEPGQHTINRGTRANTTPEIPGFLRTISKPNVIP